LLMLNNSQSFYRYSALLVKAKFTRSAFSATPGMQTVFIILMVGPAVFAIRLL